MLYFYCMKFEGPKETLNEKIERLKPIFENSLETGSLLTVTRGITGEKKETIPDLAVVEINEDGPELAFLDRGGELTASATMLWTEILEAEEMA
jgi:hypothetical protein